MKVYIANRVLSGFSWVLGFALFGTCIWTLTSLILTDTSPKNCRDSKFSKFDLPEGISPCNESLSSTPSPPQEDEYLSDNLFNYTGANIIESDDSSRSALLTDFDEMDDLFRTFVIVCLSIAITCSLTQTICSTLLIFSPNHKVASRSRKVVIIFFVIFILYLIAFGWPLAFKRVKDFDGDDSSLHTMSTLSSSIMQFCDDFQWHKLIKDLNLYYVLIFSDSLFLFLYMVMTCCLLRFVSYEVDDS